MNSIELMVIDLVQIAEAPLYSTYRWLCREMGRDVPMREFLRLIDRLIERDILRLWETDHRSHDRTEHFRVPQSLEVRYGSVDLDDEYDPFGFTLTLDPAADVEAEPAWELEFDLEAGRFELLANAGEEDEAIEQASRFFPDVTLLTEEKAKAGGRVRMLGRVGNRSQAPDR